MNTNYNFPVELQPIFLGNGARILNRQAVVRTDTMATLGVVSDGYGLVKHETVIDAFREAGRAYDITEKIALSDDGSNLFYQMIFPNVTGEVQKGDIIKMMMIAKNSYNGSNALQMILGAFRLVCSNGMVIGTKFMQFSYRHIGNVGGMTDPGIIDEYRSMYGHYARTFSERMPMITEMTKRPMLEHDQLFSKESVAFPEYLLKESEEEFRRANDPTVWGYYNSLTFAVSHKMRKESPALAISYGNEAWRVAEKLVN